MKTQRTKESINCCKKKLDLLALKGGRKLFGYLR